MTCHVCQNLSEGDRLRYGANLADAQRKVDDLVARYGSEIKVVTASPLEMVDHVSVVKNYDTGENCIIFNQKFLAGSDYQKSALGVIAHEYAHIYYGHQAVETVRHHFFRWMAGGFFVLGLFKRPSFFVLSGISFVAPFVMNWFKFSGARQHEYDADQFAVQQSPEAALQVLTYLRKFENRGGMLSEFIAPTHPRISKRLQRIERSIYDLYGLDCLSGLTRQSTKQTAIE